MYVILLGVIIILILQIIILLKQSRKTSDKSYAEMQILNEKLIVARSDVLNQVHQVEKAMLAGQRAQVLELHSNIEREFSQFKEQLLCNNNQTTETLGERFKHQQTDLIERFGQLQNMLGKELSSQNIFLAQNLTDFQEQMRSILTVNFDKLTNRVEMRLDAVNKQVDTRLNEGFEKTNRTFTGILERLSKIDEAQKKIESLSTNIISLQDVLTDKKSRGTFGEVQLSQLLGAVFGEKNEAIYDLQKRMSNGLIADAVLYTPEPLGTVAIDAKFPLENYQKMIDHNLSDTARQQAAKLFKRDVRKHIKDIADKYIIDGETSNQAIMFLPAEAIFAEINAYHTDLVQYSQHMRVWITSPTTFMAVLTTVQVILQNMEREKYATIIHEELTKLGVEFERYRQRWDSLNKSIERVVKDSRDINITTGKISKRFGEISMAQVLEDRKSVV